MPLYEYQCRECDQRFDALRSMNAADTPIPCPVCGSFETGRKLSLFSAHSNGKNLTGASSCGSCASGNCATCKH
ncbi:MAG: FmdB family zinc ribbon protein [Anaerolineales bacterium]|jgi:putative FmdB family regulatory protein